MSGITVNGNGRAGVAIALLLIFSTINLFNNLMANWGRNRAGG